VTNDYCNPVDVDIAYVQQLACERTLNGATVECCFMSIDVYASFIARVHAGYGHGRYDSLDYSALGVHHIYIWTMIGRLSVIPVSGFTNFCHVGTQASFDAKEWQKVGTVFEEVVLGAP
jgi:hypothetical protein